MARIDHEKAKRTRAVGPTETFHQNEITTAKGLRRLRGKAKRGAIKKGVIARAEAAANRKAERQAIANGEVIAPRVIRREDVAEVAASMMDRARARSAELAAERGEPLPDLKAPPKKRRPNRRQRAKIRRER